MQVFENILSNIGKQIEGTITNKINNINNNDYNSGLHVIEGMIFVKTNYTEK